MSRPFANHTDLRRNAGPIGNALIDDFATGRISRRDLLRHGAVLGLFLPLLQSVPARAADGGTMKIGLITPTGNLDPGKASDPAGIALLSLCGEYLCINGPDFSLRPGLAESWSPNGDGSVWTFKIRKGVTFHGGRPMTAADVAATFQRLADPDGEANALTSFEGILSKRGIRKLDDDTVEFRLDMPHGQFPYLVSSDTPGAIILPTDYSGGYETAQIATGPYKLEQFTPGASARYVRNPAYWGDKGGPGAVDVTFFEDAKAQSEALLAGRVDVLTSVPRASAPGLAGNSAIEIIGIPTTAHTQLHLRTDMDPFKDLRVRRALALALDRPKLVQDLFAGHARIGNDSPFAAVYPSTDKTVSQRTRDLAEAVRLLEAAGLKGGCAAELTSQTYLELPDFALAIQRDAAAIGCKLTIQSLAPTAYFAEGVFGKSPWLDSVMGLTDYPHHGTPHAYLTAPLRSDGAWNAARYKNPAYDSQVASYIGALDLDSQRKAAGEIQKTLLDDTPVIFAYFSDALAAMRKGITGVAVSPLGQILLGVSLMPCAVFLAPVPRSPDRPLPATWRAGCRRGWPAASVPSRPHRAAWARADRQRKSACVWHHQQSVSRSADRRPADRFSAA